MEASFPGDYDSSVFDQADVTATSREHGVDGNGMWRSSGNQSLRRLPKLPTKTGRFFEPEMLPTC